ncbi:MAG TPA: hypothetical protein ENI61_06115 [Ignavibacteria bacterium]|nr:hypothetical protein [Ignavibacteria bacterium]
MVKINHKKLSLIFCLLSIPQLAFANAGVPMIILIMPTLALSIIPIIIIETIYISKKLSLSKKIAGKAVTISNVVSTIVGIPLTWILLVAIQIFTGGGSSYGMDTALGKIIAVTWQAPWLIPHESQLHWMVPVSGLVLMIPFFFVSWWSEYFITNKILKDIDLKEIKRYVRNANLITYGLLSLWPIIMLLIPNG